MSSLKCCFSTHLLSHSRRRTRNGFASQSRRRYCTAVSVDVPAHIPSAHQTRVFVPFDRLLASRRDEASRSVIVQVKSKNSHPDLLSYCTEYGPVKNAFYYSVLEGDRQNQFILVEYVDVAGSRAALDACQHSNADDIVPVRSSLVWFRPNFRTPKLKSDLPELRVEPCRLLTTDEMVALFAKSKSLAEDMVLLHERTKIGELGIRLRFLAAMQLETAFAGLFPTCRALPFGSSVNSFGKINSDLDLVFDFSRRPSSTQSAAAGRLMFHSKSLHGASRVHNQRHLETIADIVQYFLPGCSNTRRILRARVPIIRYRHDVIGAECDLSTANLSGVYMSELLYLLASYDQRVCPLVFTIRYWARQVNLTNPAPGKWVTNFTLTLLAAFYLQQEKIIPSVDTLVQQRRPEDEKTFVDDCGELISCGFLSDISLLKDAGTVHSDDGLAELLQKFFEFYSAFDFRSNAISLNLASAFVKPSYDPMYIVNPLEKALNVSRNVSIEECERFRMQCRNAGWNLECSSGGQSKKWGLLDLIQSYTLNKTNVSRGGSLQNRSKVAVKDLFLDE